MLSGTPVVDLSETQNLLLKGKTGSIEHPHIKGLGMRLRIMLTHVILCWNIHVICNINKILLCFLFYIVVFFI